MPADSFAQIFLAIDILGILWLIGLVWLELRLQTTDVGRVGGVVMLAALVFALYYVTRALFGA